VVSGGGVFHPGENVCRFAGYDCWQAHPTCPPGLGPAASGRQSEVQVALKVPASTSPLTWVAKVIELKCTFGPSGYYYKRYAETYREWVPPSSEDDRAVVYARTMSRPSRLHPRELVDSWPDMPALDPTAEVARQLAENLRLAIGDRSVRSVARAADVDHSTIAAILNGRTWPDLYTIAKLERGLGMDLWPGRIKASD
jgi:transcriptional regulator with XRE-family HTH domain